MNMRATPSRLTRGFATKVRRHHTVVAVPCRISTSTGGGVPGKMKGDDPDNIGIGPDRSWDGFDDDDSSTTPKINVKKGSVAANGGGGGQLCDFSLSALVGLATMVGEERARVEAERSKTLDALTEAIKVAAHSEAKVLSDVVDRIRKNGANDADSKQ